MDKHILPVFFEIQYFCKNLFPTWSSIIHDLFECLCEGEYTSFSFADPQP